jgi:hypothetical protein
MAAKVMGSVSEMAMGLASVMAKDWGLEWERAPELVLESRCSTIVG